MAQELNVAVHLADRSAAKRIVEGLSGVASAWTGDGVERLGGSARGVPHVVIIQDEPHAGDVFETIATLRRALPDVAIFVVSAEKQPEHIVEVMKAGVAEYFLNPLDFGKLTAAVEKVRSRLGSLARIAKGAVYSFIGSRGGLGSTVVAVNAATAMALRGAGAVALVDNSLQSGDSSVLLDIVPQTTIADISRHFHRLDFSFLKGAMTRHGTGLHFLAAPSAPEESNSVRGEHVAKVLSVAKSLYDHVVVDCKSMSVDECSIEAFKASDRIFVITDLSVPAVRNAVRLTRHIEKHKISPKRIEIVVNRFIKGGLPSLGEIERTLGRRVFWLFPNEFDTVVASINQGVPVVKSHPRNTFAKSVKEFVEKLSNPSAYPKYRGAKGSFRRAI